MDERVRRYVTGRRQRNSIPAGIVMISDKPENVYAEVNDDAKRAIHRVVFEKLVVHAYPTFASEKVPRHWFVFQCNRAAAAGRCRFWGSLYNRIQICECGRDRSWPVTRRVAVTSWLGRTGHRHEDWSNAA